MEPLEELKQFLIDNNCLESYLYNLKRFKFSSASPYPFNKLIIYTFKWEATKEGVFFWSSKDCEWRTIIKNYDEHIRYNFTQVLEYLNTEIESLWTD